MIEAVLELTVLRLPVDMGGLSALVLAAGCTASVDLNDMFLRYSSMPFYGCVVFYEVTGSYCDVC